MGIEQDVVIVGSGPNGLAAAVVMARAGLSVLVLERNATIGGGARTEDLGLAPGIVHDLCSAVHPMAVASPFFSEFDLAARGVELLVPQVQYAQPVTASQAAVAYRDVSQTAQRLGVDGKAWESLFGYLSRHPDAVIGAALGDKRSIPSSLITNMPGAARFAMQVLEQGTGLWGARFKEQFAPALLTGVAAHAITELPSLSGSGTALMLATIAHSHGWPIPKGGSQSITDALVSDLEAHGGEIWVNHEVSRHNDLPSARAYLFDTTPLAAMDILGHRVPADVQRGLRKFRHGNGAAKVDFVTSEPIPWADPEVRTAGTVHLGGTREDLRRAERDIARGVESKAPVVLVSDPGQTDGSRVVNGVRPVWAYAHVPAQSDVDPTEAIAARIEAFAPGFKDTIVASASIPASRMELHNPNYVGGDIAGGAATMWQMFARPSMRWNPYSLGTPGAYLCSASTPPGPGVHGLGGMYAAQHALREVFGIKTRPTLGPR